MGIDLNYPKIDSASSNGKVEQIRSYLYQLVDQLNWAFNTLDSNNNSNSQNDDVQEATKTFSQIKGLIIKGVVEEGVTSVQISDSESIEWHYRKWVNGSYECWCKRQATVTINKAIDLNLYYGMADSILYPITFIEQPVTLINIEESENEILMLGSVKTIDNTKTPTINIVGVKAKENLNCTITYMVRGAWK